MTLDRMEGNEPLIENEFERFAEDYVKRNPQEENVDDNTNAAPVAESEEADETTQEAPKEDVDENYINLELEGEAAPKDIDAGEPHQLQSELQSALAKIKELEARQPHANEQIAKLNEYVKNGGKIDRAFWEMQEKDYSSIDIRDSKQALSVIKDKLTLEDEYSPEMADRYLKKNFPVLSGKKTADDFDSDEEYQEAKADEDLQLYTDAKKTLPALKQRQEQTLLPQVDHKAEEQHRQNLDLYRATSREALKDFDGIEIDLGEVKVKAPLDVESRKFVNGIITEPENQSKFFADRYIKEDGVIDYAKFSREMYILKNADTLFKKLFMQGDARGRKAIAQSELRQENLDNSVKPNPKGGNADWRAEAAKTINQNLNQY